VFAPFIGKVMSIEKNDGLDEWLCRLSIGLINCKVQGIEISRCAMHVANDGCDIRLIVTEIYSEGMGL